MLRKALNAGNTLETVAWILPNLPPHAGKLALFSRLAFTPNLQSRRPPAINKRSSPFSNRSRAP